MKAQKSFRFTENETRKVGIIPEQEPNLLLWKFFEKRKENPSNHFIFQKRAHTITVDFALALKTVNKSFLIKEKLFCIGNMMISSTIWCG